MFTSWESKDSDTSVYYEKQVSSVTIDYSSDSGSNAKDIEDGEKLND